VSPLPEYDSRIPLDAIDPDWIKRGRRDRHARRFPVELAEWLAWPDSPEPRPHVGARSGDSFLVTLDGSDDELAPSVLYDPARRTLSHVHAPAGHLRFLHGYVEPFTGSDEERSRIENDVRALLAGAGHPTSPPEAFEAHVGNGMEGYFDVRLVGDVVEWRFDRRDAPEAATRTPTAEEWAAFRQALDEADVWSWSPDGYEDDSVADGDYWGVTVRWGGRELVSSGANAFPPGYRTFLRAVSRLAGQRFE